VGGKLLFCRALVGVSRHAFQGLVMVLDLGGPVAGVPYGPWQTLRELRCQLGKLSTHILADLRAGQCLGADSISRESP